MMEFMNDNPAVEGYPLSYTNDPEIIARNDKMISINA
ncbi:MAG: acetyl-CoA hydrolase/transferase C-terminal domain-containing protein, partial [Smithellaceae bacterium]|nr:acetyl-CoA hydrolase/transferase C-terminal domain-containing protein [Smithellaceae bacterium]